MPSSRELNQQFVEGKHIDDYEDTNKSAPKLGGPGSQWRMMKLRRIYEAAEEEGRNVEEIALERYGTLEAFNEARMERQFIDDQEKSRKERKGIKSSNNSQLTSSSLQSSRAPSRQSSFRKPGENSSPSTSGAPVPSSLVREVSQVGSSKSSTPIPSVFDPTVQQKDGQTSQLLQGAIKNSQTDMMNSTPPLSIAALNKLSAKVMRAEMMNSANAADLRAEYEKEKAKAEAGGDLGFSKIATHRAGEDVSASSSRQVQVLPTLDARGRLYDIGTSNNVEQETTMSKSAKRKMNNFEARDRETGKIVRYNADDDEKTLEDLVREETTQEVITRAY